MSLSRKHFELLIEWNSKLWYNTQRCRPASSSVLPFSNVIISRATDPKLIVLQVVMGVLRK